MAKKKKLKKSEKDSDFKILKEDFTEKEKKENKQLVIIFSFLLVFLASVVITFIYIQQQNNFSYAGLEFRKEKDGQITWYHARFPIIYKEELKNIHNIYLRNNPKKNKIPINTDFKLSREVIITFEPNLTKCDNAIVAQMTLGMFVGAFPWVKNVSGAVTDKETAEREKIVYADCSNATQDLTIIKAKISEKASIEKESENCYVLNVANCDYLKVAERYIIGVVAQINNKTAEIK